MKLPEAFDQARQEFGRRVHQVRHDQWQAPTPCSDWSVRDLVNHLVGEQLWAPWLLRGATLEEVGDRFDGDVLGGDPVRAWDQAARESWAAFHAPDALDRPVQTGAGPTPGDEYARQMTLDLTVHAWDLARAIGADEQLDGNLVSAVHDYAATHLSSWQQSGLFAAPVQVPDDAGPQDRLLALLGRTP
ncbi:TIGR03086 family metal-binding protein [Streptomyces sp. ACA25]|uniref:TIGR03086 family metal-binding protein n=1 Tax=Streptomyces sp. ACA25 TaxID=3022596 RepID=UPI002307329A|nr:TIGR03086 family metal-binding protein [Streptomyces sp. ACA25]MDB1089286.1 TIGR03086 family metal-binding protein [Streptomyces sp. ACA25]